jgi:flagellar protein FliS
MDSNLPLANRYREVAIKTANPIQLIVILYDGAIQSLQEAKEHIKKKDIANRSRCLNRSVAIISELQASLNFNVGGDIAGSLDRLYTYMKQRIFQASVEQKIEPINQILGLLDGLRAAWGEVARQSNNPGPSAASAHRPALIQSIPSAEGPQSQLNISG